MRGVLLANGGVCRRDVMAGRQRKERLASARREAAARGQEVGIFRRSACLFFPRGRSLPVLFFPLLSVFFFCVRSAAAARRVLG